MKLVPENINEAIKHLPGRTLDEIIEQIKNLDAESKVQYILKISHDFPNIFQDFKESKELDDESNQLLFLMKIKEAFRDEKDVEGLITQLAKKYGKKNILIYAKDLFTSSEFLQLILSLSKKTKTKEEKERDEYYDLYAFIGYTEDVEVNIKGKILYRKELGIESLIKIDKYDKGSMAQISMMKMRAPIQYSNDPLGKVWCVYIPKGWLDDKNSFMKRDIPDYVFEYIEEKKFRV